MEDKPEWVEAYELNNLGLRELEKKINDIEQDIKKLNDTRNDLVIEKEKIAKWADLITKQSKTLEIRIKEAFELLGIENIKHEPKGHHGPDLVIQHKGKGFTIEIEGSKGPIRIDKARELLHWIADAPSDHKGVLIGNPFRDLTPNERPPNNNKLFVKEAVELAQNRDFVLIKSLDIFDLVCKKLKGEEVNIDDIVTNLYNANGEFKLP